MTVLIVSSFGPTKKYGDQDMMKKTCSLFIESLLRQTDPDWRAFISCHDEPLFIEPEPRIHWLSVADDKMYETTLIPISLPTHLDDPIVREAKPFDIPLTDMSRKTINSVVEAMRWTRQIPDLKEFWVLRMDSDDLLAKDHVEFLHQCKVDAVYNRVCHMWDPKKGEVAIHRYPYSTTCNALRYRVKDGIPEPDWFYHCRDHTTFYGTIRKDGISCDEKDYTLCIITNSGNSISNRPEIDQEKNVEKIEMTPEIKDRYGI